MRDKLAALVERTGADELMALTVVPGQEERLRSFELLAQAAREVAPGSSEGVSARL